VRTSEHRYSSPQKQIAETSVSNKRVTALLGLLSGTSWVAVWGVLCCCEDGRNESLRQNVKVIGSIERFWRLSFLSSGSEVTIIHCPTGSWEMLHFLIKMGSLRGMPRSLLSASARDVAKPLKDIDQRMLLLNQEY
jgi:hypothetical protein